MPRSYMLAWLAWGALTLFPVSLLAQETFRDGLRITHAFAVPTPPGAPNGAAYLIISTDSAISLVDAHTPVSDEVELHVTTMKDGAMQMRPLEALDIAPSETVTMQPGDGVHLMLFGLREPLKEGQTFPLTLEFKELDSIQIEVLVSQPNIHSRKGPPSQHNH